MEILRSFPERLRAYLNSDNFSDPVVARLYPPASNDERINQEFRHLALHDIREAKLSALEEFERSFPYLDASRETYSHRIRPKQIDAWIAFLNDVRLMLGTDLGITTSDWDEERIEAGCLTEGLGIYWFATYLQGVLLHHIMGPIPEAQGDESSP